MATLVNIGVSILKRLDKIAAQRLYGILQDITRVMEIQMDGRIKMLGRMTGLMNR